MFNINMIQNHLGVWCGSVSAAQFENQIVNFSLTTSSGRLYSCWTVDTKKNLCNLDIANLNILLELP